MINASTPESRLSASVAPTKSATTCTTVATGGKGQPRRVSGISLCHSSVQAESRRVAYPWYKNAKSPSALSLKTSVTHSTQCCLWRPLCIMAPVTSKAPVASCAQTVHATARHGVEIQKLLHLVRARLAHSTPQVPVAWGLSLGSAPRAGILLQV